MKVVDFDTLDEASQQVIRNAKGARFYARADYSGFKVGAAVGVETLFGWVVAEGCNVENVMYEVGHAEQAAVLRLATLMPIELKLRIDMVAVALVAERDDQHAMPCGFCRQWLREFGNDDTVIYGVKLNTEGDVLLIERFTLGELLPYSFGPNNLCK